MTVIQSSVFVVCALFLFFSGTVYLKSIPSNNLPLGPINEAFFNKYLFKSPQYYREMFTILRNFPEDNSSELFSTQNGRVTYHFKQFLLAKLVENQANLKAEFDPYGKYALENSGEMVATLKHLIMEKILAAKYTACHLQLGQKAKNFDCPPFWNQMFCSPESQEGQLIFIPCPNYVSDYYPSQNVTVTCNPSKLIEETSDFSQCDKPDVFLPITYLK